MKNIIFTFFFLLSSSLCQTCPEDMTYAPDGVYKTCDNLNGTNQTASDGCVCGSDKVYNKMSEECTDPRICENSPENQECRKKDPNKEYTLCQSANCIKTCKNQQYSLCVINCEKGCFCKDGYVLHRGKCVTPNECP